MREVLVVPRRPPSAGRTDLRFVSGMTGAAGVRFMPCAVGGGAGGAARGARRMPLKNLLNECGPRARHPDHKDRHHHLFLVLFLVRPNSLIIFVVCLDWRSREAPV